MVHRSSLEKADDAKLEAAAIGIEDVNVNTASNARDKLSLRQLVVDNIASWFVVNSLGRRTVFLTGMASLLVILFLTGIMDVVPTAGAQWVQAAATVIYNFVYFATIGSMAYTILGEASSAALRARTTGLAAATQSVLGVTKNFACPYMVNPDEANLQGKVGFVFGGLCLFATVWSFFYVPELKGRSMAEIDQLFHRGIKPRKMGSFML